ncbi:MAG: DNA-binding protein [Sodalis sp. (in: enterobacteria)]|uniref:DNA-binding protein n=1 Tax=Sodalis sp. (in: enterobacteria) TaxID=1898979 RepID=UPI0039E5E736
MNGEIWVTVQEFTGLPGLPGSAPNVRKKLETFVQDNAALCRKREGSKAMEYHLSALPAEIRAAVLKRRNQIETSQGLITLPEKKVSAPWRTS